MQKTDKWSEQMSFYRFFNNEKVTEEALTGCMEDHCLKHCARLKEAVLIEDTSEINLERHRNRIRDREGSRPAGNGKDLGFFCHPTPVTDPENRAVIGAIDLHIWAREERTEGKAGKKEINWTLHASHKVETMEEAVKTIKYYESRWLIEDLFRTVKSEGVNFEASEWSMGRL